jgi:hypothetical protein
MSKLRELAYVGALYQAGRLMDLGLLNCVSVLVVLLSLWSTWSNIVFFEATEVNKSNGPLSMACNLVHILSISMMGGFAHNIALAVDLATFADGGKWNFHVGLGLSRLTLAMLHWYYAQKKDCKVNHHHTNITDDTRKTLIIKAKIYLCSWLIFSTMAVSISFFDLDKQLATGKVLAYQGTMLWLICLTGIAIFVEGFSARSLDFSTGVRWVTVRAPEHIASEHINFTYIVAGEQMISATALMGAWHGQWGSTAIFYCFLQVRQSVNLQLLLVPLACCPVSTAGVSGLVPSSPLPLRGGRKSPIHV